jgi:putative nucleotidyltransferase with HDIG domain
MSAGTSVRSRAARVATVAASRKRLDERWQRARHRDVWSRIGVCFAAALVMWVVGGGWSRPFPYRSGHIPPRDIVARSAFNLKTGAEAEESFEAGKTIAIGGKPLTPRDLQVLYAEHQAHNANSGWFEKLLYSLAQIGVYLALFGLCGSYIYFHDGLLLSDSRRLVRLVGAVVVTVTAAVLVSRDAWRAECIPLVLFGMTLAIVSRRELAFVLSLAVALVIALSLGQGLYELMVLTASVSGPVIMLNRVRSRTKLIYVGMYGAVITFVAVLGVGLLADQTFGAMHVVGLTPAGAEDLLAPVSGYAMKLVSGAAWHAACVILAGFIMTGLLPFTERLFDVQTDISLLELGDAAHPLLQELAQRAPGTYNHSINVAALSEAAADRIGANGLLVRVGAYFHDIGKMLKPAYFVENQGRDGNQHESLLPAMSTLVIIAHVKDGVDLGRQYHLPQSIIAFIEQHHGTTLVEYFYRQAERQVAEAAQGGKVEEASFRYPGPKPQTKEAAVLMLADAAESACRTLVEPTPARIEGLVHEITMKRLLDGQFESCGITLKELNVIEESLVKSLTAVYHGRIKYPDQQTA